MSLEHLRYALLMLDEPPVCTGQVGVSERIAIMLPDGDVAALDDPRFIDWLVTHGEPAPFGQAGMTKLDPAIRHATRLRARGAAEVTGIDIAAIVRDVEAALAAPYALSATLADVLVYPVGGHFALHKDTPRSPDLVGTLVVELPSTHAGGAFVVDDGSTVRRYDWSGPADHDHARWVALYTDVDHAIEPVTAGARLTLVYALTQTAVERHRDRAADLATLRARVRAVEMPAGPLMIACTRQVIGIDEPQPQGREVLRGLDREIADVFVDEGYTVRVRTCLAARDVDGFAESRRAFAHDTEVTLARLAHPLLDADVAALLECVVFEQPWGDGGGYEADEASSLVPFLVDTVDISNWIFRETAAATFLRAVDFASDGYVGNAASETYLYKLAALEITR